MSRIEQLIAELCPDGVEYKDLSSITKITTGKLNANAMKSDGLYPYYIIILNELH
jgi:type I restriction enzyme S subunit